MIVRCRVAVVAVVSHGAPRVTQVAVAVALLELTLGVRPSGAARVRLRVEEGVRWDNSCLCDRASAAINL